ncbi:MAG: hypothetical protein U0Y68_14555 [Blastocatellia bacterium]
MYFVAMMALLAATVLYVRQRYLYGTQTTWGVEFERVSLDIGAFWQRQTNNISGRCLRGCGLRGGAYDLGCHLQLRQKVWKIV